MLDSVTADSVFAEIMMDETSAQAFLLVEGPDENSVFFGHVGVDVVLIICGGKKTVLGAANLAESNNKTNVYGLVDRDFDTARGLDVHYPNHVVATETYDLISDLVLSSPEVLRRVLSAHAVAGVALIEETSGAQIDDAIFALTTKLAGARLATMRAGYPLIFKGFNFAQVMGPTYEAAEMGRFLEHAACKDPHFTVDAAVVQTANSAYEEVRVSRETSGGHDIVGASVALLHKAGSQVSTRAINGTLISVASCSVIASLSCLSELTRMARSDSDVELFDCFAAA